VAMEFETFSFLPAREVAALVEDRFTERLGVAVHFDGTRRWYLRTYGACEHDLYNEDYASKTMQRIRDISEMMFRDGVTALYLPALGKRIEVERGPQYARFQADSLTHALLEEDMLEFCRGLGIRLSCYGGVERLATRLERELRERQDVAGVERYMRWGVFAGSPLGDFSQRAVALSAKLGRAPTAAEILADYYAGPHIPVHIWIGQKRPSVYGVPFLLNSRTSLYFLQFPTPLLDRLTWRRVLYDAMYIRGDDSELFPEDVPLEREILGLGKLADGRWVAQQTC